jgi:hypothetical protein
MAARPAILQASIPFLSSTPTIWAFSSSASAMASASPLPRLKSVCNFATSRQMLSPYIMTYNMYVSSYCMSYNHLLSPFLLTFILYMSYYIVTEYL